VSRDFYGHLELRHQGKRMALTGSAVPISQIPIAGSSYANMIPGRFIRRNMSARRDYLFPDAYAMGDNLWDRLIAPEFTPDTTSITIVCEACKRQIRRNASTFNPNVDADTVAIFPCDHNYHTVCLDKMCENTSDLQCPVCYPEVTPQKKTKAKEKRSMQRFQRNQVKLYLMKKKASTSSSEQTTSQKKTPLFIERDLVVQAIFDTNEEEFSE